MASPHQDFETPQDEQVLPLQPRPEGNQPNNDARASPVVLSTNDYVRNDHHNLTPVGPSTAPAKIPVYSNVHDNNAINHMQEVPEKILTEAIRVCAHFMHSFDDHWT